MYSPDHARDNSRLATRTAWSPQQRKGARRLLTPTEVDVAKQAVRSSLRDMYGVWYRSFRDRLRCYLQIADASRVKDIPLLLQGYSLEEDNFVAVADASSDVVAAVDVAGTITATVAAPATPSSSSGGGGVFPWQREGALPPSGVGASPLQQLTLSPAYMALLQREQEEEATEVEAVQRGTSMGLGKAPGTRLGLARRIESLFLDLVRFYHIAEPHALAAAASEAVPPAAIEAFNRFLYDVDVGLPSGPYYDRISNASLNAGAPFFSPVKHSGIAVVVAKEIERALYSRGALPPSGFDRIKEAKCPVCSVELCNPCEKNRHLLRSHPDSAAAHAARRT